MYICTYIRTKRGFVYAATTTIVSSLSPVVALSPMPSGRGRGATLASSPREAQAAAPSSLAPLGETKDAAEYERQYLAIWGQVSFDAVAQSRCKEGYIT